MRDGVTGAGLDPRKKRSRDLVLDACPELRPQLARLQTHTLLHLAAYLRKYPFALIGGLTPTILDPETNEPAPVDIERFARDEGCV